MKSACRWKRYRHGSKLVPRGVKQDFRPDAIGARKSASWPATHGGHQRPSPNTLCGLGRRRVAGAGPLHDRPDPPAEGGVMNLAPVRLAVEAALGIRRARMRFVRA